MNKKNSIPKFIETWLDDLTIKVSNSNQNNLTGIHNQSIILAYDNNIYYYMRH